MKINDWSTLFLLVGIALFLMAIVNRLDQIIEVLK